MPKNKGLFRAKWLDDPRCSQWLKKKSDEVALCSYRKREINISNMGETALTSHLKAKKHQEISKFFCTSLITSLLKKPSETENKSQDNMLQTSKKQVGIDNLMVSNATTKVEIRWLLNMVYARYSKKSLSNVNRLFAAMFPDSEIAKNFQYSSTKASYVTTYGLALYFHSLLLQKISSSPRQIVSFESLNNSVQKGKMDLLIHYWDNDTIRTECVPVTWDLNLWDAQPLTMFLRPSRMGFLRVNSQNLCKSHLTDLMSTLHF